MDVLADRAREAKADVEAARRVYHAAVAAVVREESARAVHGAQVRAARRLGLTAQVLSKMLSRAGYQPTTGREATGPKKSKPVVDVAKPMV